MHYFCSETIELNGGPRECDSGQAICCCCTGHNCKPTENTFIPAGDLSPGGFARAVGENSVLVIKEANIGLLRQWLNEDRITDPSKMVTSEQIKKFLSI
jgi:hypothetical protein